MFSKTLACEVMKAYSLKKRNYADFRVKIDGGWGA